MQRLSPTRMVLVLSATFLLAFVAFVSVPKQTGLSSGSGAADAKKQPLATSPSVSALDWLPQSPARDGSVDYTVNLQAALDAAAGGTLLLPDFPVRVSKRPGTTYCLIVRASIEVRGSVNSRLLETQGEVQILRVEVAKGVRLSGFTLVGHGGQGADLTHGLLSVHGGEDVSIEGLSVLDADADGISVDEAKRVTVRGCRVQRASRSGLHLARCVGGVVAENVVEGGTGHHTGRGAIVGAGIQMSGCTDVVCTGNVVRSGVGIGMLVDADPSGVAPSGCALVGNRVSGWRNAENPDASAGIRLENSAGEKRTRSLVSANTVERCGAHGIDVLDHDGASLLGNTVVASDRSSICIATSRGVQVLSNVVLDTDAGNTGNQAGLLLVDSASGVVAHGNRIESRATSPSVDAIRDESSGGGNSIETQQRRALGPPAGGAWGRGDVVWNAEPWSGAPLGWVCTSAGTPGVWSVFGRIE